VVAVAALGSAPPEVDLLLAEEVSCSMRHEDGSTTAITLGSGGAPTAAKERIEVLGGGRTAVIDDFRHLELDGRRRRLPGGDAKGHVAMLRAFAQARAAGDPSGTELALASVRATLAAARSMSEGVVVPLGPHGG
jgi:hypothetical protein